MIKSLSQHTCAFDCEWVPCTATARRLLDLPPDTDDRAATEAVWAHYRGPDDAPESRPFLKLVLSQVVSIAVVMRDVDPDGTVHLKLGARSVAMCPEAELIQRFLEKVATDQYQLFNPKLKMRCTLEKMLHNDDHRHFRSDEDNRQSLAHLPVDDIETDGTKRATRACFALAPTVVRSQLECLCVSMLIMFVDGRFHTM